jgi:hypothetical protein
MLKNTVFSAGAGAWRLRSERGLCPRKLSVRARAGASFRARAWPAQAQGEVRKGDVPPSRKALVPAPQSAPALQ